MIGTLGRYRILRHLATGGMGEVYLAEAVGAAGFAKKLVIKTLRADLASDQRLMDQFVAEGRLLEALDHPNIASILDLGIVDDTTFLAMEYVEGFDLRALLRALPSDGQQRLAEAPTLCVVTAVAEALDHAATRPGPEGRAMRIVHHDVTPSNIMVRPDGHIKLVDFGIARSKVRQRLAADALRGKLPYLSPEQARMESVDGRTDLFALGLVGAELLVGRRLLDVSDLAGLAVAHENLASAIGRLADLGVHEETVSLLRDMTVLARKERVPSAGHVAERARARLLSLGESSLERPLAQALAPAFAALQERASGFDATLASLVGPSGPSAAGPVTGTVSLPGISLGQAVPAPAPGLEDAPAATASPVRLRKRVVFAALSLLGLVGFVGWWLGSQAVQTPAPAIAVQPGTEPVGIAAIVDAEAAAQVGAADAGETGTPDAALSALDDAGSAGVPLAHARDGSPPDGSLAAVDRDTGATGSSADDDDDADNADNADNADARGSRRMAHDAAKIRRVTARPARNFGTVVFLVLPADAEVRLDGAVVAHNKTGRYRLRVSVGTHTVAVRDPVSGNKRSRRFKMRAGRELRLPGFQLVAGVP